MTATPKPEDLQSRNVLFVSPLEVSCGNGALWHGSVTYVGADHIGVCYLQSYHSRSAVIPLSQIVAVEDMRGTHMKIGPFVGRGHDLRGKAPFGTHPLIAEIEQ